LELLTWVDPGNRFPSGMLLVRQDPKKASG
jgi:hypothetical protein